MTGLLTEGELHLAVVVVGQQRLDWDLKPSEVAVLFLKYNLAFILVSENLFVKE